MAQAVRGGQEERRMQSDERHCISTNLLKWTSSPPPPSLFILPDPSLLTSSWVQGQRRDTPSNTMGGTDSGFGARQLAQESSEGDDDDF